MHLRSIFSFWLALAPALLLSSCGRCCKDGCHIKNECNSRCCKHECCGCDANLAPAPVPTHDVVVPVKPVQPDVKPIEIKPDIKPVEPTPPPAAKKVLRIRAGSVEKWKDKSGNEWLADSGFTDGAMIDNGKISVANTDNPELYSTQRVNMDKFSWPLPNGKYTVKLYFVETLDDVTKAGEHLFSIDVQGEKIKDLDIFKEAGGARKALVKTVHANVNHGKLEIDFIKSDFKEPVINAIEISPE